MTRRIVTGQQAGKSCFLVQLANPDTAAFRHIPGFEVVKLWATSECPQIEQIPADPIAKVTSVLPPTGGIFLIQVTFPPDSVLATVSDWAAAGGRTGVNSSRLRGEVRA